MIILHPLHLLLRRHWTVRPRLASHSASILHITQAHHHISTGISSREGSAYSLGPQVHLHHLLRRLLHDHLPLYIQYITHKYMHHSLHPSSQCRITIKLVLHLFHLLREFSFTCRGCDFLFFVFAFRFGDRRKTSHFKVVQSFRFGFSG